MLIGIVVSWGILALVSLGILVALYVKNYMALNHALFEYPQAEINTLLSYLTQVALLGQVRVQNTMFDVENSVKLFMANSLETKYFGEANEFDIAEPKLESEGIIERLVAIKSLRSKMLFVNLFSALWVIQFIVLVIVASKGV